MAAEGDRAPARLTDAQLAELLALTAHADSVELKLTVPDSDRRAAVDALDLDPLDGQLRQVYFFDTPQLALNEHGVVVRARRSQGRGDDTVVKLRPVDPVTVQAKWPSDNLVVEVDVMPGAYVCSASMKGTPTTEVREVARGARSLHKLYSREQRAFFDAYAPAGVAMDGLAVLGPINVLKLKLPVVRGRKLVSELWFYPDGTRILELSAKARPAEAFQAAAELRADLLGRGLDLGAEQHTKTRTALEFFAAELNADT